MAIRRASGKQYNYDAEVIDPRGWTTKGAPNRDAEHGSSMADYYGCLDPNVPFVQYLQASNLPNIHYPKKSS